MKTALRPDWYTREIDPVVNLEVAGVYQWSITGVGIYVGKAKKLRGRLLDYPRNVRRMIEGRPWHGNPLKEYRAVHHALKHAYETGLPVSVAILEICHPDMRSERERWWIDARRREEMLGGPRLLNAH